jgi:uncharacterized membrane protein
MRFLWVMLLVIFAGTILGGAVLPGDLWMAIIGAILFVATVIVGIRNWEEMGRPR